MGKIVYGKSEYKNFGECLTITNGLFEMYITTDVGPRIIKFNPIGKENIMFEDVDRVMNKPKGALSEVYGEDDYWNIYGGHRFWISPEAWPVTYYPDNDKVEVEICGNTVKLMPPVQKVTGFKEITELTFHEDSTRVEINHILENTSSESKNCAIWAITVLSQKGKCIVPQSKRKTGLLSNRTLMLWPYTDICDERLDLKNDFITLTQSTEAKTSLKFGINNEDGYILYSNYGYTFKKSFKTDHINYTYPDNGCSCEVYTNRLFLEAESLSPLKQLSSGEKITHTEVWEIVENSDCI